MTNRQLMVERLRQLAEQQNSTADESDILLAAVMIERDDAKDKRRIINEFISKVEKLVEEKMQEAGKRVMVHHVAYFAMKKLQREMNDE